jgi:hypothetical protein
MKSRRSRLFRVRRAWQSIKRFLRIGGDDEPALVGNEPRLPLLWGAVALPLPEPPRDIDARGRDSE